MNQLNGNTQVTLATTAATGVVKPDGSTITIAGDGTISAAPPAGGGASAPLQSNANGYYRMWPDGTIEQWGRSAYANGGQNKEAVAFTFPVAFPNNLIFLGLSPDQSSTNGDSMTATPAAAAGLSGGSIQLVCNVPTGGGGGVVPGQARAFFYAIGN